MKKKLRKRISAGLIISVLAVMAALLAVFAIRPHLRFVAGEYLGLNTRKITVAKISPELDEINIDALRADSRVTFDQSLMLVNSEHPLDDKDKPDLAEYKKTGVIMNACAAESFSELSAAVMERLVAYYKRFDFIHHSYSGGSHGSFKRRSRKTLQKISHRLVRQCAHSEHLRPRRYDSRRAVSRPRTAQRQCRSLRRCGI